MERHLLKLKTQAKATEKKIKKALSFEVLLCIYCFIHICFGEERSGTAQESTVRHFGRMKKQTDFLKRDFKYSQVSRFPDLYT